MDILKRNKKRKQQKAGFSLPEVLVGIAILGIGFATISVGIAQGFRAVNSIRENIRAAQIMVEKLETIRLYTWDQVNSTNFVPRNFTAYFDPLSASNSLSYQGVLAIGPAPINAAYSNEIKEVSVSLTWNSLQGPRQRQMSTYYSRYGLQDYIY